MIRERAFAKLNLVLHVGPRQPDGMHPLASLFASIDLADEIDVRQSEMGEDRVGAPGSRARTSPTGRSRRSAPRSPTLRCRRST